MTDPVTALINKQVDLTRPLTNAEEIRLSTLSNFITLACFRPLDTFPSVRKYAKESGHFKPLRLWSGWPLQALNKAVDDEVFNGNIRRVTSLCEDSLNLKNPSATPHGKALVGTAARILTLGVMVPYNALQDQKRRKEISSVGLKGLKNLPATSLYAGFRRSLVKESVFTSSYVLLSAYFGQFYSARRHLISQYVDRLAPKTTEEEMKKKYTDVAIASMKAASAGVVATLLTQPIDNAGKGMPAGQQIVKAARKATRKGCYNAVNTAILQTLTMTKVHRRLLAMAAAQETKQQ